MRLVRTINDGLTGLTKTDHPRAQVGCETCHRGLAVPPRPLGDILADKALASGPDAGRRGVQPSARRGGRRRPIQLSRARPEHRRAPAARGEAAARRHRTAAEECLPLPPGLQGSLRCWAARWPRAATWTVAGPS